MRQIAVPTMWGQAPCQLRRALSGLATFLLLAGFTFGFSRGQIPTSLAIGVSDTVTHPMRKRAISRGISDRETYHRRPAEVKLRQKKVTGN